MLLEDVTVIGYLDLGDGYTLPVRGNFTQGIPFGDTFLSTIQYVVGPSSGFVLTNTATAGGNGITFRKGRGEDIDNPTEILPLGEIAQFTFDYYRGDTWNDWYTAGFLQFGVGTSVGGIAPLIMYLSGHAEISGSLKVGASTFSANGISLASAANYAAMKALLDLEIGTDVQAYDADLTAIAGVTYAADKVPLATGPGAFTSMTVTAAARTILDDTTVDAIITTLGGAAFTGTGGLARATSPTFVTPVLGVAAATSIAIGGGSAIAALVGTTYSPTPTDVANAGTITSVEASYSQVGKLVTVSFAFTAAITTTSIKTQVSIPLPAGLTSSAYGKVRGSATGIINDGSLSPFPIFVQCGTNNLLLTFYPNTAASCVVTGIAQYMAD